MKGVHQHREVIPTPTAVINSVAKLPNHMVAAGQLLNMRFAPAALQGDENLKSLLTFCMYLHAKAFIIISLMSLTAKPCVMRRNIRKSIAI